MRLFILQKDIILGFKASIVLDYDSNKGRSRDFDYFIIDLDKGKLFLIDAEFRCFWRIILCQSINPKQIIRALKDSLDNEFEEDYLAEVAKYKEI